MAIRHVSFAPLRGLMPGMDYRASDTPLDFEDLIREHSGRIDRVRRPPGPSAMLHSGSKSTVQWHVGSVCEKPLRTTTCTSMIVLTPRPSCRSYPTDSRITTRFILTKLCAEIAPRVDPQLSTTRGVSGRKGQLQAGPRSTVNFDSFNFDLSARNINFCRFSSIENLHSHARSDRHMSDCHVIKSCVVS
jgi:hypothetical protein